MPEQYTTPFTSRALIMSGTLWIDLGDLLKTNQFYGWGGDGDVDFDGISSFTYDFADGPTYDSESSMYVYTLNRDIHPKSLFVRGSNILRTNGYRILGTGNDDITVYGIVCNDGQLSSDGSPSPGAPSGTVPGGFDSGYYAFSGPVDASPITNGIYSITASGGNGVSPYGASNASSGSMYSSYMSEGQYDSWLASPGDLLKAFVTSAVDIENTTTYAQPQCGGGGGFGLGPSNGGGGGGCVVMSARSITVNGSYGSGLGVVRANGASTTTLGGGGGGGLVILVTRLGVTASSGGVVEAAGGTSGQVLDFSAPGDNYYGNPGGAGLVIQSVTG